MQKDLLLDNSKVTNDHENIQLRSILLLVKNIYIYISMIFMSKILPIVMRYMKYVPLVVEIYLLIFGALIIKLWCMMNLLCTILFMNTQLIENNQKVNLINTHHINVLAILCVVTGTMLIIFCVQNISIISLVMIIYLIYLINRTTKDIFGLGL